MIRSFYRSARVPNSPAPYDTLTLRVFYPARFGNTPLERNTGEIPADPSGAPYPVVIFFPGVNVGMEAYAWLGAALAQRCVVTVLYSWITEDCIPGSVALTPGIDLNLMKPNTYGTGSTASALPTLLAELNRVNEKSLLAGMLDLNHIVLGGHSAGGTMALMNANREWFPSVVGAFAYGAHSGASIMLGYPPATVLPLPNAPLLIVGGTQDGVIESSSHRYALDGKGTPTLLLELTFAEATTGPATLVLLSDATHFLICHPHDDTTGRGFLEAPTSGDENALRAVFVELVIAFVKTAASGAALSAETAPGSPLIAKFECK